MHKSINSFKETLVSKENYYNRFLSREFLILLNLFQSIKTERVYCKLKITERDVPLERNITLAILLNKVGPNGTTRRGADAGLRELRLQRNMTS